MMKNKILLLIGLILTISFIFTIPFPLDISKDIQNIISFPIMFIILLVMAGIVGVPYFFIYLNHLNYPMDLIIILIISLTVIIFSIIYRIKNKEKRISKYLLGLAIFTWFFLGLMGFGFLY